MHVTIWSWPWHIRMKQVYVASCHVSLGMMESPSWKGLWQTGRRTHSNPISDRWSMDLSLNIVYDGKPATSGSNLLHCWTTLNSCREGSECQVAIHKVIPPATGWARWNPGLTHFPSASSLLLSRHVQRLGNHLLRKLMMGFLTQMRSECQ